MTDFVFFLLLSLAFATAQLCPSPESLSPCICSEATQTIECRNPLGTIDLKKIFDRASGSVGDDAIFDTLIIQDTSVEEIEDGTFESWRFINIEIISNPNLSYISPKAFNASRNITEKLNLFQNRIDNDVPREQDIYKLVRSFRNLVFLDVAENQLSSLPDNAFANMDSLEFIRLTKNRISHFGSRAFANLPNLRDIWLQYNNFGTIPALAFANLPSLENVLMQYTDGINFIGSKVFFNSPKLRLVDFWRSNLYSSGNAEDAFEGIAQGVSFNFTWNPSFSVLEEIPFRPLLEKAEQVEVGGVSCVEIPFQVPCIFQKMHCDERIHWICDDLEKYEHVIRGYICLEYEYTYIDRYCRSLP